MRATAELVRTGYSLNHARTLMFLERFKTPVLDKERSNIENSENTVLFLISCFQYILSAIVLSIGPPFRQSMTNNGKATHCPRASVSTDFRTAPFVITIVVTLLISLYMLFDPAEWLAACMQLTYVTAGFKVFLLVLAIGGFVCAWIAEGRIFLWVARVLSQIHDYFWPHRRKKRKQYKLLQNSMRI